MPAGKAAVSGGVEWVANLHFGVNIRSLRQYKKRRVAVPSRAEIKKLRRALRFAFQIYMIDCASAAPTGTKRRKALRKIQAAAALLVSRTNAATADDLLTALDTRDVDARKVAYRALTAKGHKPLQFKRTLRHWTIVSSADRCSAVEAAKEFAGLDVQALIVVGGRFPDPGLARLVVSLIPVWRGITGRTAGLIKADFVEDTKKCPFATWLAGLHDLLGITPPPIGRVVDIVRWAKRNKNPAPLRTD